MNKPLFLYWGAVWCPPCNQIKKTIFTRREFQEKMKLFLPVYLDGDTKSAQIWGEKLKASVADMVDGRPLGWLQRIIAVKVRADSGYGGGCALEEAPKAYH